MTIKATKLGKRSRKVLIEDVSMRFGTPCDELQETTDESVYSVRASTVL